MATQQSQQDFENTEDAFTAALTTVYHVHFSKFTALQNIIKNQRKRIKELESHGQKMKHLVKSSKAKIRQQLKAQKKLETILDEHSIPIPLKPRKGTPFVLSDSSNSSGDEESIDPSSLPHNNCMEENMTESNILSSSISGYKMEDDFTAGGERRINSSRTNECNSDICGGPSNYDTIDLITSSSDSETDSEENISHLVEPVTMLEPQADYMKAHQNRTEVCEIGVFQSQASERPSKIKFRKKCTLVESKQEVSQKLSNSPIDPSQSASPSPSLLLKPLSPWANNAPIPCTKMNDMSKNECKVASDIPPSDSQFSLDVSQTFAPSLELPSAISEHSTTSRKRYYIEAFDDHLDKGTPIPTINKPASMICKPCDEENRSMKPQESEEYLSIESPLIGHLPKTPGVRAMSSMALDKDIAFFAGIKGGETMCSLNEADTNPANETSVEIPKAAKKHAMLVQKEAKLLINSTKHLDHQYKIDERPPSNRNTPDKTTTGMQDSSDEVSVLAVKAGLPTYKCDVVIRNPTDRKKLDAKECSECKAWYSDDNVLHCDRQKYLKLTCRHKSLYQKQDSDPKMWDISFPSTEECEQLLNKKH